MLRASGTEAPGARRCGQADALDELRARVSSWPPLRLARLRCERGTVDVVSPAAPAFDTGEGGAPATRDRHRHPPDLRGGGDLGEWPNPARGPGGDDPHGPGGVRQATARDGRSGHRGNGQLHGGLPCAVTLRGTGCHRQSAPGEGDRACPCEDRQGRRRHAGEPSRRRLSARDSGRPTRRPSGYAGSSPAATRSSGTGRGSRTRCTPSCTRT